MTCSDQYSAEGFDAGGACFQKAPCAGFPQALDALVGFYFYKQVPVNKKWRYLCDFHTPLSFPKDGLSSVPSIPQAADRDNHHTVFLFQRVSVSGQHHQE